VLLFVDNIFRFTQVTHQHCLARDGWLCCGMRCQHRFVVWWCELSRLMHTELCMQHPGDTKHTLTSSVQAKVQDALFQSGVLLSTQCHLAALV
jgi:hypothetical protein